MIIQRYTASFYGAKVHKSNLFEQQMWFKKNKKPM